MTTRRDAVDAAIARALSLDVRLVAKGHRVLWDAALEEAAKACEDDYTTTWRLTFAATIRALKSAA